jgi:lipopolysaccharide/colanic/teichoic acid biosynthesis glycosyltransferase
MNEKINLLYIGTNKEIVDKLKEHPRISLEKIVNITQIGKTINSISKPNVVICERFLSDGDGFSAFQLLSKYLSWNSVIFFLVAEHYENGLVKHAMTEGINDLYVLPLPSNEDLLSRIDFLINYKKQKQIETGHFFPISDSRIPLSKRLFDIIIASFALIVLSPLLLMVMIAIRVESKGKVFYSSIRVGQKPFKFYKFRSMRIGAENELKKLATKKNQYITHEPSEEIDFKKPCPCIKKGNFVYCSSVLHTDKYSICDTWYITQKKKVEKTTPPFIKIPDDPRVTRVGKIIRNTSIDEIPQLINVIKGDMSIVGNRPLPLYEAEKLTSDDMAKRFLAPAGLTGLWQVEKRGRKGIMSDEERKNLDVQYAELFLKKKYSLDYDMKLIMRTLPVIIQKESV